MNSELIRKKVAGLVLILGLMTGAFWVVWNQIGELPGSDRARAWGVTAALAGGGILTGGVVMIRWPGLMLRRYSRRLREGLPEGVLGIIVGAVLILLAFGPPLLIAGFFGFGEGFLLVGITASGVDLWRSSRPGAGRPRG